MQKLPINPFLDFYSTPDAMIINPFVFGGGAFDPLSLSPALWLSDTGADASTWPDLSGNGRDATQADAAKQPAIVTGALNGRQVRRFDGVNDFLATASYASAGALSVFVVATRPWTSRAGYHKSVCQGADDNATDGWAIVIAGPTVLDWVAGDVFSFGEGYNNPVGAKAIGPMPATADGAEVLISTRLSASGARLWINGAQASTRLEAAAALPTNNNPAFIGSNFNGSSQFWDGDIAEILIYPAALGTPDRQNVENYLNAKYAIY